ncbi:MAG: ATP-binding protein [Gammaproteobacteria bacterium]
MNSLQGRLTVGLLTSLIVVFVLQLMLVSLAIRKVTENYVVSRLDHENENVLSALSFNAAGAPVLDTSRLGQVYHRPFSGHYFRVATTEHVLRSRSLWDRDLNIPNQAPGTHTRIYTRGPQHQELLVLAEGYRKQGVAVTIAAAEDISPVLADIRWFQISYALLTGAVLIALVIAQRVLVRRSLRPLEQARENLARLESGAAQEMDEAVPREIRPLVQEINRLVQVTVQRLTRSRNAVGNLAHALKTPLTVLTQLSRESAAGDDPERRQTLETQIGAMRRMIDRELKRARLAGEGPSGARFLVESEVPPLMDALRHMYREKNLQLESRIPAAHSFAGDREDMLELIGNLLDNACKWARSHVRLTVETAPGLAVAIEDDGPGVSSGQLDQLIRRGVRLDESAAGHGLGLSIVSDIVRQYGGDLGFDRSPDLHGLRVRVRLPAARAY